LHNCRQPPWTPATELGKAGENERKNALMFGFQAADLGEGLRCARRVFGSSARKGFWFYYEEGFFVQHCGRLFCPGSIEIEFPLDLQSHVDFFK